MARNRLSARERRAYAAGGFRFVAPSRRQRAVLKAELAAAIAALRCWQVERRAVKAALAIPSARRLSAWRKGESRIGGQTRERMAIVLTLHHRLIETGDVVTRKPLPDLRRRSRPPLSGRAVLAGGRLSDLLALLAQLVRAEEVRARRTARRRR